MNNFLRDDRPYYGDADFDENYLPENDPIPGGDADGFYDDVDDGIIESLVIIGLAGALVFLIYYRQRHQLAHRGGEAAAGAQAEQPVQGQQQGREQGQQQENIGPFPRPGDPNFNDANFNDWAAGAVGH
jgi:SEL1 protein